MADNAPNPPPQQENSWVPAGLLPLVFDQFEGINTEPSRPGIEDQQMFICDGFFPLGPKNLRTLPDIGPALFTPPTSLNSSDQFNDLPNVLLENHTGQAPSDLTWTRLSGYSTSLTVNLGGDSQNTVDLLNSSVSVESAAYVSSAPIHSANYSVSLSYLLPVFSTSNNLMGPMLRANASATAGYAAVLDGVSGGFGGINLINVVTGATLGTAGSVSHQPAAWPVNITISSNNNTISVTAQDANGNWLTSAGLWQAGAATCISVTSTTFPNPGQAGIYASVPALAGYVQGSNFSVVSPINSNAPVFFDFGNIGSTPLCICALADGSLFQINTNTKAFKQIAPAGTVTNPSPASMGISQWGARYIVIVANQSNGFWLWDGTNLFAAGTLGPDVTINDSGLDYTSQPTITVVGGSGSGASIYATLDQGIIQGLTVTNPGAGFSGLDAPVLAFSGGGCPGATARAAATVVNGTLSHVGIAYGGLMYTTAVTASVLGGGGAGATVSVTQTGGSVTAVNIIGGGEGYSTSDPPTISFTDPNNPVCQATVDVMPFGISGTDAENFHQQLWVINGPLTQFTAPGSIVDFSTSSGGGSFESTDSFLRVGYANIKQTNGFLYLIGDSSINYISGVQTSTPQGQTSPVTTFNNVNVSPEVGTPWGALDVWDQGLLFGNQFGVHITYGGAVKKVSDPLNGVYFTAQQLFSAFNPSAGKAIIFGRKVWMILLPVIDQITGQEINRLFIWDGKYWFSSLQSVPLIYIQHQEINSIITAYGTDGNSIYPLFQSPSSNFTKTLQTKLLDTPSYIMTKTQSRLFGLANYYSGQSPDLTISVDNETGGDSQTYDVGPLEMTWTNNTGGAIAWTNNTGGAITWLTASGIVVFAPSAVAQNGALTGLTLQTNAADMAILSLTLVSGNWQYRG